MATTSLSLEIITPEGNVYETSAKSVVLPSLDGQVGILPGHQPLLTELAGGEVAVESFEGGMEFIAVDKGFARIQSDAVSVLTEAAVNVEDIEYSSIQEAQARAQEALKAAERAIDIIDPEELQHLEAVARFAIIQKLIKDNRR